MIGSTGQESLEKSASSHRVEIRKRQHEWQRMNVEVIADAADQALHRNVASA